MVIYSTFTNFVIKTVMHKFYIDFIIYIRSVSLVKTYIYNNMPKDQNSSNKYTFKKYRAIACALAQSCGQQPTTIELQSQ